MPPRDKLVLLSIWIDLSKFSVPPHGDMTLVANFRTNALAAKLGSN